jgi:hypothetical protein
MVFIDRPLNHRILDDSQNVFDIFLRRDPRRHLLSYFRHFRLFKKHVKREIPWIKRELRLVLRETLCEFKTLL